MEKTYLFSMVAFATFLAACGDETTTNIYEQNTIVTLEANEDLPNCSTNNDGAISFVPDSGIMYLCHAGNWEMFKGLKGEKGDKGDKGDDGEKGDNGTSCSAKDTISNDGLVGINFNCGGKRAGTIWNGTNGSNGKNGTSCDAVAVEGGFNIVCGDEVKGILKNGTNGINGKNGTSCDAIAVENGFNIVCDDEVKGVLMNGINGSNGTSCNAIAVENGFNIVCDDEVKGVLTNGTNGINGKNGTSCNAIAVEGGFNIVCDDEVKGVLTNGTNGTNGTSCDVVAVEASEDTPNGGFNIVCDNEVKGFLRNGTDGVNGTSCDAVAVDGGFNIVCGGIIKGFIKSETEPTESSSSEIPSSESSSSERSSSSVTAIQTGDNTTGSIYYPDDKMLKDLRDGRTYKTTSIGNQIWMAENMFYQNATSWTFTEATRSSPYNVCPNGWKVPSKSDYETLISTVGGSNIAAAKLKATKGWDNNGNGNNESGFSATPYGSGTSVSYWTSTEGSGCSGAWIFSLRSSGTTSSIGCANQTYSYPLRCLKK